MHETMAASFAVQNARAFGTFDLLTRSDLI